MRDDEEDRVREHVTHDADEMAKIALAATPARPARPLLRGAGPGQKPHTHEEQDKIYFVVEGRGRFSLGADEERSSRARRWWRPPASRTASSTTARTPLLVLVVVTPPPPHAKAPGH